MPADPHAAHVFPTAYRQPLSAFANVLRSRTGRLAGVEPAHLAALEPKSGVITIPPPEQSDGPYQF